MRWRKQPAWTATFVVIVLLLSLIPTINAFLVQQTQRHRRAFAAYDECEWRHFSSLRCLSSCRLRQQRRPIDQDDDEVATLLSSTTSFETSDASSKGIVSFLTSFVNLVMTNKRRRSRCDDDATDTHCGAVEMGDTLLPPATSAIELMNRIRDDYTVKNYLWTGDIDLASFETNCRFTDPTISFVGTQTYCSNVGNLRIVVDMLILNPNTDCQSNLLDINLNDDQQYVQTRWNMVGQLNGLPWKPRIDVVGRTKFWYRKDENDKYYRVYFYDECWELPPAKALLQLVTPAGTIRNSESLQLPPE